MINQKLPSFSQDLLKELDGLFPERCPDINDSERMVWFRAGQRYVVNFLLTWSQAEDGLENILSSE